MGYYILEFVVVLFLAAAQVAWAPGGRAQGLAPDLVLVAVVLVGLFRGSEEGAWTGLAGALCLGALTAAPLGGLFVGYMGCGVVTGMVGQQVFSDRLALLMFVTFASLLAVRLVGLIFVPSPTFGAWLASTVLEGLFTALLALPLGWIGRLILHRPVSSLGSGLSSSILTRRG
ncbi:MAG TPA: hypothetical protein VGM19_13435 [Armatimonadota bacterium]|jgi:hypothetical protein